eukprot:gene12770-12898_t
MPGSAVGLASLGAGSIAGSSVLDSGPPSTSGGMSASAAGGLGLIQAHAESSQRSAASLKLLQQHIDELTVEKLELERGLHQQVRANEALAEENQALGDQHNGLAASLEHERQRVKRLEAEMVAAATTLTALAAEREAHKAAAQETTERANALAAENVALDNQLLEVKSVALRLERDAALAASASRRLEQQLAELRSRAAQQGAELTALQAERRILKARLMQFDLHMNPIKGRAG